MAPNEKGMIMMACAEKFGAGAVRNILRHNRREIEHSSNHDIDPKRLERDYILSPDRGMTEYDYFLQRKSELYKFEISMALTETPIQDKAAYLFAATYKALECEKKGIPYATTKGVLFIIELLRNNVCCWERSKTPGKEWMVYPILKDNSKEMSCLPRVICKITKAAILTSIMKCGLQSRIRKSSMTI